MRSPSTEVDIEAASLEQLFYEQLETAERRRRKKGNDAAERNRARRP